MRGRNDQYQFVFQQRRCLDIAASRWPRDKTKRDLLLFHSTGELLRIAADQSEVNTGMLTGKVAQLARQHILCNGGRGAEGQFSGAVSAQSNNFLFCLSKQRTGLLGIFQEDFSCLSQRQYLPQAP